jgi:hypothetical protein
VNITFYLTQLIPNSSLIFLEVSKAEENMNLGHDNELPSENRFLCSQKVNLSTAQEKFKNKVNNCVFFELKILKKMIL